MPDDNKMDDLKGRAKEAAGSLADDDDLRREGKTDQAEAHAKSKADELADKGRDLIDKGEQKVKDIIEGGRKASGR